MNDFSNNSNKKKPYKGGISFFPSWCWNMGGVPHSVMVAGIRSISSRIRF